MNKNIVLLKTLLRSTSLLNIHKYCKDKKKRGRIVGGMVGQGMLFLMLIGYCIANCIGYGIYGLTDAVPVMCALLISTLSFVFTLFKTNGYLFNFKEYDMLMSLPFEAKDVAACKFMYMYIKALPWYASVSVSMLIGYSVYAKPSVAVYPVWVILSVLLPVIPMLGAAFLGFLTAKIGSGFKNKTIAQTVLSILTIIACFGMRFFIEDMFKSNKTEQVMNDMSEFTAKAGGIYLPVNWFTGAVTDLRISDILLLIGVTLLLFEVVFIPVGRSYKKINSALRSHAAAGRFVMSQQKTKSLLNSLVFKEFKRMTGSTIYLTNGVIGELMCFAMGIAVLFINIDDVIRKITNGSPLTKEMLYPAIPYIVYFFIGMMSTTTFTPSLEGKNYWIVQSLPIKKKMLYMGKMLFNLYLTVPFMIFTTVTMCISTKASLLSTVLYLIHGLCLCGFSTAWGCVCGIKHMRLDWENEVEVIKQGAAVTLYLFPNMIATMGLTVLSVFLGTKMDQNLVTLICIFLAAIPAGLSYLKVMSLTKE